MAMVQGVPRGFAPGLLGLRLLGLGLLSAAVLSCGARTSLLLAEQEPDAAVDPDRGVKPTTCAAKQTQCVTRDAADPCGMARLVSPTCDAVSLEWRCPAGAWLYARATQSGADCLPLHVQNGLFRSLQGSLSRIPTDEGRCLWVAEEVQLTSGQSMRNVAFEVDPRAPFGSCPSSSGFAGGSPTGSVVFSDGSDDPTLLVQITGGYRLSGKTRVTYRLFRLDSSAVFGVTELGTGLGYWDAKSQRIVVSGAERPRFQTDLDFGNAAWVEGNYAYIWGCNAPGHFLTEGCLLGRLDAQDQLELFTGNDQWNSTPRASAGSVVFDDGPWISSVTREGARPGELIHVFAADFDDRLQIQSALRPQGPWGGATSLTRCALPAADDKAYCAGPIVHEELADPTQPATLVVSYGLGTTGPLTSREPEKYWSRLTWAERK